MPLSIFISGYGVSLHGLLTKAITSDGLILIFILAFPVKRVKYFIPQNRRDSPAKNVRIAY